MDSAPAAAAEGPTRLALVLALGTLPPELRVAVVLRDVRRLPYAQVARGLGCSVATARARVNQARLRLHRHLAGSRN